jgi:hypothetical protein
MHSKKTDVSYKGNHKLSEDMLSFKTLNFKDFLESLNNKYYYMKSRDSVYHFKN